MTGQFDPNISKTPVFSAPFRRKFFEPADPPFNRSFAPRLLIAPPAEVPSGPPDPVVAPEGQEYYRLSDVKAMIDADLRAQDEQIHDGFVKQLTDFLAERWESSAPPCDADTDLPSYYS
jgi:hypothetical protein